MRIQEEELIKRSGRPMRALSLLLLTVFLVFSNFSCAGLKGGASDSLSKDHFASGEVVISGLSGVTRVNEEDNARVFYEIFVGSFADSDGDGTGDLRGIIEAMDYLQDGDPSSGESLGIEGIWLTPVFKSPSYHKYDVSDYYAIDRKFGTEADLIELAKLCEERGVKLILDLVLNHTSNWHPWFLEFQKARRMGKTDSEYYSFYSCYEKGERAPEGRTYSALVSTDVYYECNFSPSMPELDFNNEKVREKVLEVAEYYLNLGIDGFRFDAAKYIYLNDHEQNAAFWSWYASELREMKDDIYLVGEVWDGDSVTSMYYPAIDCFDFTSSGSAGIITETVKGGPIDRFTSYVERYTEEVRKLREGALPVFFLTNHDMDRAAGFLATDTQNMHMAANLYLLAPGSPFLYYGEELGMKGSRGSASTDANRRLSFPWDGALETVTQPEDPEGTTYKGQQPSGASSQLADGESLYQHYKKLILIRRAVPEIGAGRVSAVQTGLAGVGGLLFETADSQALVLHNLSQEEISMDLRLLGVNLSGEELCFAGAGEARIEEGKLILSGRTSAVFK